ncbi:hypothetical protein HYN49_06020 [Flavobacterium pallidum]|uniref:Uncharacterized protein n=1 Tax=Flavobacterium pallidum TaxID=2172098 RepID=A0A2S1SGI8_9FLAO|nr:hypothetical protein HYN49_06020 [Flavobacterium pallidum]
MPKFASSFCEERSTILEKMKSKNVITKKSGDGEDRSFRLKSIKNINKKKTNKFETPSCL